MRTMKTSPLPRLPAELRNKIYEYAFDTAIPRPKLVKPWKHLDLPAAAYLNALRKRDMVVTKAAAGLAIACRQLKAETVAFFKTY